MAKRGHESSPLDETARFEKGAAPSDRRNRADRSGNRTSRPVVALPDLSAEAWSVLEKRVGDFEEAWMRGETPSIKDYLLEDDPTRGQLLIELVFADLELRSKYGSGSVDYLAAFPQLAARPDVWAAIRSTGGQIPEGASAGEGPEDFGYQPPAGRFPRLEGYEIRREIGRGGMGVVYLAEELSLHRAVAIKTLLPGSNFGEQVRLQREAEAVARIQHPNVAQVFRTITQEGRLYVVSEYLPGGTLAARLTGEPWKSLEAVALVETLCQAVSAAHQLGIVHRDLKPANILFSADDVPNVADFGLIKLLDEQNDTTRTGVIAGSPSYMAPEQATGQKTIGVGVDIWTLGAILYELLTGRAPFRDATVLGTLELVRSADPVAPRRFVPRLPPDLETICMHCLEKSPEARYESVAELGDDLARYRRGEAIRARPIGRVEAIRRWAARNRAVAVLCVLLAISLATGTGASIYSALDAHRKAEEAKASAEESAKSQKAEEEARRKLERILFATEVNNAHKSISAGDPALAADLIAREQDKIDNGRSFALNYLDHLVRSPGRTIDHLGGPAYKVRLSPDETLLAACGQTGTIHFYHAGTWEPAGRIVTGQDELNGIAFSHDARQIASAGDDGSVVLWDRATGEEIWRTQVFEEGVFAFAVEFVLDDRQLAVGGFDGTIVILDAESGEAIKTLHGHRDTIQDMVVTPDGRTLISIGDDRRVINWNLQEHAERWRYEADSSVSRSHAIDVSGDGRRIVIGSFNSVVTILETSTGKQLFQGGANTTRISPDTGLAIRAIALVGPDEDPVVIHDGGTVLETQRVGNQLVLSRDAARSVWRVPRTRVRSMIEFNDGASLITASDEGFVDIWHRRESPAWTNIRLPGADDCAWIRLPNGRNVLAVASIDEQAGCWLIDPQDAGRSQISQANYSDVAATRDGRYTVFGSESRSEIAAFDLRNAEPRRRWLVAATPIAASILGDDFRFGDLSLDISHMPPNGPGVFVTGIALEATTDPNPERRVVLFRLDRATGELLAGRELAHSTARPARSPDGETLVVGTSFEANLHFMNPEDLTIRETHASHPEKTSALCFSPDGTWLASTGADLRILLWRDGKPVHAWRNEAERIGDMAFNLDGAILVTSSGHHPPRLWDVETRQLLLEAGRYPLPARRNASWTGARFSIDGQHLAIANDSVVTIFNGQPFPNRIEQTAPDDAGAMARDFDQGAAAVDGASPRH